MLLPDTVNVYHSPIPCSAFCRSSWTCSRDALYCRATLAWHSIMKCEIWNVKWPVFPGDVLLNQCVKPWQNIQVFVIHWSRYLYIRSISGESVPYSSVITNEHSRKPTVYKRTNNEHVQDMYRAIRTHNEHITDNYRTYVSGEVRYKFCAADVLNVHETDSTDDNRTENEHITNMKRTLTNIDVQQRID